MPRKLTKLKITEVASVDRGAGEGVRVMLSKRDFSAEERRRDAKSGAAMSDGSFPIHNREDLRNAMRLAGNAKNPAKARAHIRSRARALGLSSMLSDASKEKHWLTKAREAFGNSIASILGASNDVEKVEELIGASADQFVEHVAGMTTDDLGGEIGKGEAMTPEILKALGLADGTDAAAVLKAIETLKAGAVPDKGKGGDEGGDGGGGKKEDDDEKKKALVLPESITKALAEAAVLKSEVETLKKAAALEAFTKKAVEIGLPASQGETLMKAYAGGGNEAVDTLVGFIKAANAQAMEAGIFKEFGASVGDGPASALDELNTLAAQLRKADPKLSADQAFAKVYTDPANAKLAAKERSENRPTIVASR